MPNKKLTNKHAGCKRGFTQLSKAWYGSANLARSDYYDEVNIGLHHRKGGSTGEFAVRWELLAGKLTPKLTAYDDGWSALFNFSDMLEAMAGVDDENISPDAFCVLLEALGIENMTDFNGDKNAK